MKKILTASIIFMLTACSSIPCSGLYGKIGAGYALSDSYTEQGVDDYGSVFKKNSPYVARLEAFTKCGNNINIGYSHRSQWLTGWPINDDKESNRDEVFFDYAFKLR